MSQLERIKVMFGAAPQKPRIVKPEVQQVHSLKRMTKADFEALKQHAHAQQTGLERGEN
ncbi:MAG TPA: NapH/MauN family ferredoxin-type protein, partial [Candidatus Accumulibacter sp.]|nr:NapH/MauN family ferredoxin-type protein [Accumulibacter sp.]